MTWKRHTLYILTTLTTLKENRSGTTNYMDMGGKGTTLTILRDRSKTSIQAPKRMLIEKIMCYESK